MEEYKRSILSAFYTLFHFNLSTTLCSKSYYYPPLWMKKLRHRETKHLVQGHRANKSQQMDSNSRSIITEPSLLKILEQCLTSKCAVVINIIIAALYWLITVCQYINYCMSVYHSNNFSKQLYEIDISIIPSL